MLFPKSGYDIRCLKLVLVKLVNTSIQNSSEIRPKNSVYLEMAQKSFIWKQ